MSALSPGSPNAPTTIRTPGRPDEYVVIPADAIPGYRILREVHRGGQGVVYEAHASRLNRRVAIKVTRGGPFAGPQERVRFEREMQILAQLNHPNIVTIHDGGIAAGHDYFVMDYIAGQTLDEHVAHVAAQNNAIGAESGRSRAARIAALLATICRAVAEAHRRGIVHRDLKPSNIRVDEAGTAFVLDFGLAKMTTAASPEQTTTRPMTQTGEFLGSLPWASPEQVSGAAAVDARSDVYSLGVVLYQALAGRLPYEIGPDVRSAIANIQTAEPRPLRKTVPDVSQDLETIVLTCLKKEPARRYADASKLADDLKRCLDGEPIAARRDSSIYLASRRIRNLLTRHPIAMTVLTIAAAVFVAQLLVAPLVFEWTNLDGWYECALVSNIRTLPPGGEWNHVRVIAMQDQTDMQALADSLGLDPPAPGARSPMRRVHGRLMKRLAEIQPRAVVWDVWFAEPGDFDADLVDGVRALRDAGVPVIFSAGSWRQDDQGRPHLSPALLPVARWGSINVQTGGATGWALELIFRRGDVDVRTSIALEAVAACAMPGEQSEFAIDDDHSAVQIRYRHSGGVSSQARVWLPREDRVGLSTLDRSRAVQYALNPATGEPERDVEIDDVIGYYLVAIPTDAVLQSATIPYEDVFSPDLSELRRKLRGRVALVGGTSGGLDRSRYPDGRDMYRCYAQATGIEALLADRPVRMLRDPTPTYVLLIISAVLGWLVSAVVRKRFLWGLALVVALAVAALAAGVIAYGAANLLVNPLVAIASLLIAFAASRGVDRLRNSV
ncbi:MAG: protein kinase [Phycisphaerae bacterium]